MNGSHVLEIIRFSPGEHAPLIPALTEILHRAYAPLLQQGLRYWASHQPPEVTLSRLQEGEGYLLFLGEKLIGTVSLNEGARKKEKCDYYSRPGVYYFSQFAIDPAYQGMNYGKEAIAFLEKRARELGASELALDTSEKAADLIRRYSKLGFKIVSETRWADVNYRSVILSKKL